MSCLKGKTSPLRRYTSSTGSSEPAADSPNFSLPLPEAGVPIFFGTETSPSADLIVIGAIVLIVDNRFLACRNTKNLVMQTIFYKKPLYNYNGIEVSWGSNHEDKASKTKDLT